MADFTRWLKEPMDWLKLVLPEFAARIGVASANLLERVPARCSAVFLSRHLRLQSTLVGRGKLVDFDDSLLADACWEIGRFLAMFKKHLPLLWYEFVTGDTRALLDRAQVAYIESDTSVCGQGPDAGRQPWFRLAWEIRVLPEAFCAIPLDANVAARQMRLFKSLAAGLCTSDARPGKGAWA